MSKVLPIKVNKGRGTPVVLLHGLGNNHKSWTFVLRRINYKKLHVIVPDLLGFGDAPKPKNCEYTPADHAKAVIHTIDSLKLRSVILAGHSMGCIVAVEVARQRPDLVRQLVLLGAPFYVAMPKRSLLQRLKFPTNMYFAIFSFLKDNPDFTITGAKGADALPTVKGMEVTQETWMPFTGSLNNTIMQFQSYKDMLSLQVPTILVCGLLDVFVIRKNLKAIARKNRKWAKLKTVLGPHEITPLQGRKIAKMLGRFA